MSRTRHNINCAKKILFYIRNNDDTIEKMYFSILSFIKKERKTINCRFKNNYENKCIRIVNELVSGRNKCLEKTMLLHFLLFLNGIGSTIKIGISRYPVISHSWVEIDGKLINENTVWHHNFIVIKEYILLGDKDV